MKIVDLYDLLRIRMTEKGYEGKEITVAMGGLPYDIETVRFCVGCNSFHIFVKRNDVPQ